MLDDNEATYLLDVLVNSKNYISALYPSVRLTFSSQSVTATVCVGLFLLIQFWLLLTWLDSHNTSGFT